MASNRSKLSNRKFTWLIVLVITIILGVTGFIFKRDIKVKYYNLTNNHFKRGDKVYVDKEIFGYEHNHYNFYRLIRPISQQDIEDMTIDKLEKSTLKNLIDPSLKPYLIRTEMSISSDTLNKYRSTYIGTYLYHKALNFKNYDTGKLFEDNAYAIEPEQHYTVTSISPDDDVLPKGYTWADKSMYLPALWITDKEYPGFKK